MVEDGTLSQILKKLLWIWKGKEEEEAGELPPQEPCQACHRLVVVDSLGSLPRGTPSRRTPAVVALVTEAEARAQGRMEELTGKPSIWNNSSLFLTQTMQRRFFIKTKKKKRKNCQENLCGIFPTDKFNIRKEEKNVMKY